MTPPRTNSLPVREFLDSSPRDSILSARGRYPRGMVGQQLPKLTGVARQRYKEQKRRIEQLQAHNKVNLVSDTAAVGSTTQEQGGKQGKKRRRGNKGGARLRAAMSRSETQEKESIQQDINSPPDIIDTQRHLLALPVKEETSVPTVPPPVGDPHRKRRLPRERNKKPLHSQRAGQLWFQDKFKDESVQTFTHGVMPDSTPSRALTGFPSSPRASNLPEFERVQQKDVDRVVDMVDQMNQDPRKWRQLSTNSQWNTPKAVVLHEYSQESLGMTSEERQTEIHKQQAVMNKAYDQTQCQNDASKDSSSKGEYKLPEGDQRLDWDTDLVRRLFGEIE
ncbi:hypothetical protein N0V94_004335 [Neodidymelliopsis sp. IMI 364377]|nr:hypothetical protein N0V94_004335 [Neodidymelliopsis sp. IMI 364377]